MDAPVRHNNIIDRAIIDLSQQTLQMNYGWEVMTLAKVFSKTDRWLGAKVQRRNTERQRRRRRKKEKTVEWGRTAAREFLLMSVRRRARENSDTSSAGVKNIHPVNDCARLGRIVSSSSSPPKTLLSISLFCGLILVWFSFWCKMVVVWQPEMIVFHQPGRIYSWLAIFGPFLTMTRHDSSSLNVLPLFLSFHAGRDT